jgi:rhodanese-related sulfurtransferase
MATAVDPVKRITAVELAEALQGSEPVVVLDVRRRDAWANDPERIPGAIWLPLEELPRRATDLGEATHIVLYCD